jgi:hypothetical protein
MPATGTSLGHFVRKPTSINHTTLRQRSGMTPERLLVSALRLAPLDRLPLIERMVPLVDAKLVLTGP